MSRAFVSLALAAVCAAAPLPQDTGATGTWQKLQKLRTIASVMHTTAHPDDEHGGLLATLSRGDGARVSLLTLNRGEAGDNAVGPELFDALGLIRTEELLRADQFYGVDQQYFTSVVDYGFSKRLEEALNKWGRENVLRDVVAIVRMERPLVLIARFQGNERDGHGNHQAAGVITQEAYKVAGDPSVFPEQIREGLRPWQPLKLYVGGLRENEDWTIRLDTNVYSPWLGDTYGNFARIGLGLQRSQNAGRVDRVNGPALAYYKRLASRVDAPAKETSFFDGIDIRPVWYEPIGRAVEDAIRAFSVADPSRSAPALARGLTKVREERARTTDPDILHRLDLKEHEFVDAMNAALGIEFTAIAHTATPVVPGQTFELQLHFAAHGTVAVDPTRIDKAVLLTPGASADFTQPNFHRQSISQNRYTILSAARFRPWSSPPFAQTIEYRVDGVPIRIETPVVYRQAWPPYGYATRELPIVPALAVNVSPRQAILPLAAGITRIRVDVELMNNASAGSSGQLSLKLPKGWRSEPATIPFAFARAGERSTHQFTVSAASIDTRDYSIDAVAAVDGHEFTQGYDVIERRDLETRYLYHPATTNVRGVDVKIAPGLKVGYVMGVGDDVPSAIAQLGVDVTRLARQDLASGDLSRFDAIMTGTRAYGVREDLKTYNGRLLEYVKNGGNLIVLYNTPQEFDPNQFAPYPAQLPRDAEEVSEEDSPVEILAPSRPEFTTPNRIAKADFDGWIEQRGSKFLASWDPAYTPMIATHDQGQAPQRGGWVTAGYGKGRYTYFAYAFHRQLPYGVPGAYRLLANLLTPFRQ